MLFSLEEPTTQTTPVEINFNPSLPVDDQQVTVCGFGGIDENSTEDSWDLLYTEIKVMNQDVCMIRLDEEDIWQILDNGSQICATTDEGGKDTCKGDSGGPMYDAVNNPNLQFGIVSYGSSQCGLANVPGVYVRTSAYADWIKNGICRLSAEPPDYCECSSRSSSALFFGKC